MPRARFTKVNPPNFPRDAACDFKAISAWLTLPARKEHSSGPGDLGCRTPLASGGIYISALVEECEDRVTAAYGDNHDRLLTLKNKHDPANLFRPN